MRAQQIAQTFEALGRLCAGIAHEINTPLHYVGTNIEYLLQTLEQPLTATEKAEMIAALQESKDGLARVSELVRALKSFAHIDNDIEEDVSLTDVLSSVLMVSRNEWKYVADVKELMQQDLPHISGYRGALQQVFLNLIVNAAHACESKKERGVITISSQFDTNQIQILITDTGSGIPEHLKEKIFEPYFTTKPVGKGSGQGLQFVREIVELRHHGKLSFTSTEGKGTTFTVTLPIKTTKK